MNDNNNPVTGDDEENSGGGVFDISSDFTISKVKDNEEQAPPNPPQKGVGSTGATIPVPNVSPSQIIPNKNNASSNGGVNMPAFTPKPNLKQNIPNINNNKIPTVPIPNIVTPQKTIPVPHNLPIAPETKEPTLPIPPISTIKDPVQNTSFIPPNNPIPPITTPNPNIQPVSNIPNSIHSTSVPNPGTVPPIPANNETKNVDTKGEIVTNKIIDEETPYKKALRTYESDVAEFMTNKRPSVTSMAIAESEKKQNEEVIVNNVASNTGESYVPPSHSGKKLLMILVSLVLIVGGLGTAYYFYSQSVLAPRPITLPTNQAIDKILPSNTKVNIAIDNLSQAQILTQIRGEIAKNQDPNTLKEITLTKVIGLNDKEERYNVNVVPEEILDIMDIEPPDMLRRSLKNSWMLGVYADANGSKDIFVIVTNNFFQNAFAGMLSWEDLIADDLKAYLPAQRMVNIPITSTTTNSTSTREQTPSYYSASSGQFYDGIIKNRDVRIYKDAAGNIVFLYSFIDNEKLIFTSKEDTLKEIITRLEKQSFVR